MLEKTNSPFSFSVMQMTVNQRDSLDDEEDDDDLPALVFDMIFFPFETCFSSFRNLIRIHLW